MIYVLLSTPNGKTWSVAGACKATSTNAALRNAKQLKPKHILFVAIPSNHWKPRKGPGAP